MMLKAALKQLESLGDEKVRAHNAKNGAGTHQFGVKRGDIRKVAVELAERRLESRQLLVDSVGAAAPSPRCLGKG